MDRLVETALGQAGDFAGASRWREAAEALGNGLRIAVVGTVVIAQGVPGVYYTALAAPAHTTTQGGKTCTSAPPLSSMP